MTTAAVILAAGSGTRAGGERPKQYQRIGGRPVLWWALKAFAEHPGIDRVLTVLGADHRHLFGEAADGLDVAVPVTGGRTRQESCRAGLEALARFGPDRVLIHDAARPFIASELIGAVLAGLDRHKAIVPALPIAETLKFAPDRIIAKTLPRADLWAAQTPQGFHYAMILAAHRAAAKAGETNLTDDAAVAERAGVAVAILPGQNDNRKLTLAADLDHADRRLTMRALAELPDIRTGLGIDVHAFAPGDHVMLCGVRVPHGQRLHGHSDADAALHALTDALLGSLGEGDIGTHFPPSDPRWQGAPSRLFLAHACGLLGARRGLIANVDLTILCEAPRIAPHIPAMKAQLSDILKLSAARIAIKATTTEQLGCLGRGEGLAALAVATVRLPEA